MKPPIVECACGCGKKMLGIGSDGNKRTYLNKRHSGRNAGMMGGRMRRLRKLAKNLGMIPRSAA